MVSTRNTSVGADDIRNDLGNVGFKARILRNRKVKSSCATEGAWTAPGRLTRDRTRSFAVQKEVDTDDPSDEDDDDGKEDPANDSSDEGEGDDRKRRRSHYSFASNHRKKRQKGQKHAASVVPSTGRLTRSSKVLVQEQSETDDSEEVRMPPRMRMMSLPDRRVTPSATAAW
eukprot:jgi/Botrbrau1/20115/Bobra.0173s0018.1